MLMPVMMLTMRRRMVVYSYHVVIYIPILSSLVALVWSQDQGQRLFQNHQNSSKSHALFKDGFIIGFETRETHNSRDPVRWEIFLDPGCRLGFESKV